MSDQTIKLETLELAKQAGVNLPRDPINYSQTLIQKWLREKHNAHIEISVDFYTSGINYLCQVLIYEPTSIECCSNKSTGMYGDNGEFDTYESALEFALILGLNYVINNKLK